MIDIKYKRGLYCDIPENRVLSVRQINHKYRATILDKNTMNMIYSKEYSRLKNLNNFLNKFEINLIIDKES